MRSVNLSEAEFYGKVSSPTSNREVGPRDCRHCGSQLAGRYRGVRFIGERAVRVWACPCGHERHLEAEEAIAA
jgi:hypothetical protein